MATKTMGYSKSPGVGLNVRRQGRWTHISADFHPTLHGDLAAEAGHLVIAAGLLTIESGRRTTFHIGVDGSVQIEPLRPTACKAMIEWLSGPDRNYGRDQAASWSAGSCSAKRASRAARSCRVKFQSNGSAISL